jgi:Ca-activated chloride channel family protein
MIRWRLVTAVLLGAFLGLAGSAQGRGILIPNDRSVPPLALVHHRVAVTIEDQVAVTKVEQVFRNPTPRPLEATYVFPVPPGASVREFAMWVDGKRVRGELVEAARARQIYTDIVRRTLDPGLLEYLGQDLLQLRVFPVPANGDQKIEMSLTSLARKEGDVTEYIYPLRTDARSQSRSEGLSLRVTLRSQQRILNIYSPSHSVSIERTSDHAAVVGLEADRAFSDRDFLLYWTTGGQDVGLTALAHKPSPGESGYVLLLLSPRPELSEQQQVPRDMVFVIDTSGSMREDGKMEQAKRALKYCLDGLRPTDRFAILHFATVVGQFREGLLPASPDSIQAAKRWVDALEATGGTAIDDALQAAMSRMSDDTARTFTIVFLTDGKPTVGETNPDRILANVLRRRNVERVRIFVFGVGHDLEAAFLDQLAQSTRGSATFVRPGEDMELKVSQFFAKITRPVLSDLQLTWSGSASLSELYPQTLPDLFHGGQVTVLARYHGSGSTQVTLTGSIGAERRQFVYTVVLPEQAEGKQFVEDLWARRKVGFLLDQIRLNGEKRELVEEVVALARKYGIATPYTSYLVVPDEPVPLPQPREPGVPPRPGLPGPDLPVILQGPAGAAPGAEAGRGVRRLAEVAKELKSGDRLAAARAEIEQQKAAQAAADGRGAAAQQEALARKQALDAAREAFRHNRLRQAQQDRLGVDLSVQIGQLRGQSQQSRAAVRRVAGRQMVEVGGVWVDEGYDPKMPTVILKALSDGYFKLLDHRPQLKELLALGNYLVFVTPSGTALVIDLNDGVEQLSDEELARLFPSK